MTPSTSLFRIVINISWYSLCLITIYILGYNITISDTYKDIQWATPAGCDAPRRLCTCWGRRGWWLTRTTTVACTFSAPKIWTFSVSTWFLMLLSTHPLQTQLSSCPLPKLSELKETFQTKLEIFHKLSPLESTKEIFRWTICLKNKYGFFS